MAEKLISVTEKVIGDTLYIIESVVSSTAKRNCLRQAETHDTEQYCKS